MPSITLTIEDNSPIISYSTGWRAGHSADDELANLYSQSSFTVTNIEGASASFTFNGTGVEIYGAKRFNHGLFQVKLDNTPYPPSSGYAPDTGVFQEPIFSVGGLAPGLHTVTLINQEKKFLDIDFITWESTIGTEATGTLYAETFQDTNPSFTYLPSEEIWGTVPRRLGSFSGGSGHATTQPGASLVYSFNVRHLWSFLVHANICTGLVNPPQAPYHLLGDGVSLYGPIGPDGTPYSVQIDGHSTSNFTTNKEFYAPQTLLYHATSLGPGTHNLTLIFQPDSAKQMFAIDYANVFTTTASSTDRNNATMPPNATQTVHSGRQTTSLAIGAITGMGVSVIILLALFGGIYISRRRTRKKRAESPLDVEPYQNSPTSVQAPFLPPILSPLQTTHLNRHRPKGSSLVMQSLSPGSTFTSMSSTSQPSPIVQPSSHPSRSENPPLYTEDASAS